MKKRMLSVLLAALLVASATLVSCSTDDDTNEDKTQGGNDTKTADATDTTTEETDRADVKDSVPEDLKFNGETLQVIMRGDPTDSSNTMTRYELIGTDGEGDVVSEAVWQRNLTVEERLNLSFNVTGYAGGWSEVGEKIKAVCMADSNEFDYINSTSNTTVAAGLHPYLRDLSQLPYVDYDEVWWWSDAIEALQLDNNHVNFILGDSLIYCYTQTGVFYFNKTLYENVYGNPDEMYQIVMDGNWTIDKLMELTEAAYVDANGDGIENYGDQFGAVKTSGMGEEAPHFVQGFAINMYTHDEDGRLIINMDQDRASSAFEKLYKFWNDTIGVFQSDGGIDDATGKYFSEGNILFYPGRFSRVLSADFRNMDDPYGILPYPKLDDTQDAYSSLIHDSSTSICIPRSLSEDRFEIVGAWLECLTAESWRSVMPEFLEVALKSKYSRDSQSSQVIDIVVASVTKNSLLEYTGKTNDLVWGSIINPARNAAEKISDSFASAYASLSPNAQKVWDENAEILRGE